jgi:hypothetical protein
MWWEIRNDCIRGGDMKTELRSSLKKEGVRVGNGFIWLRRASVDTVMNLRVP